MWPTAFAPGTASPSIAAVTKMRSFHTIGDECPLGSSVFQATFLVADHSVGTFASLEIPWLPGPRHWGQFSAESVAVAITSATDVMKRLKRIMRNGYRNQSPVASSQ